MRETTINPGYYLVGRHDGEIEPFFVSISIDASGDKCVYHHVSQAVIDCSIECSEDWFWHIMEELVVPNNWLAYPPSIKEPPYS